MTETLGPEENAGLSSKRNNSLIKLTVGILAIALLWLLYWIFYLQYYEFTDDAYAGGNLVNINPAVSGPVVAFFADDTDYVSQGQLLVKLDDTEHWLNYKKELSNLSATVLQVRQLYDNVEAFRATVESKRIEERKAQFDFDNRSKLIAAQAVSNEDYTHAKDTLEKAKADLKRARADLFGAMAAAGNTLLLKHPLIEKQKAVVRAAFYPITQCSIYAPCSGYIAQRTVEVGQWATPITNLMAIIQADYTWVDANFKETQLTYMRIDQPAQVTFDLYGSSVKFQGKVVGISSGTGSVFSIIPPQNATGNWIKIVQRLAVRILIDPKEFKHYPMRLGISASVTVDITNQDLPQLAQPRPEKHPLVKTDVYEINFDEVDRLMDAIIKENTKLERQE